MRTPASGRRLFLSEPGVENPCLNKTSVLSDAKRALPRLEDACFCPDGYFQCPTMSHRRTRESRARQEIEYVEANLKRQIDICTSCGTTRYSGCVPLLAPCSYPGAGTDTAKANGEIRRPDGGGEACGWE